MGRIKMRNFLFSRKLKLAKTRLVIIDDHQLRYNEIVKLLQSHNHSVEAILLDDLKSFEKQLNTAWDIIIFGRAYDFKLEQAISLVHASSQPALPILLMSPENYTAQDYTAYIHKGVYEVIHVQEPEHVYISILKALSCSRLQQSQARLLDELDTFQSHVQLQVEESNKAVAVIQEGIHVKANAEYLSFLGLKDENELIGLPVLDLLQPEDITAFKQKFRRISQGVFDQAIFEIVSKNKKLRLYNPIKLEFLPFEDDSIQLVVEYNANTLASCASTVSPTENIERESALIKAKGAINRQLNQHAAHSNALVIICLSDCPKDVFEHTLKTMSEYFVSIHQFLKDQINLSVYKVTPAVYVGLVQAESEQILQSQLMSLKALEKPHLLNIGHAAIPLHLKLGFVDIAQPHLQDEIEFESLLETAFKQPLPNFTETVHQPKLEPIHEIEFTFEAADLPEKNYQFLEHSKLKTLQQKLELNDIQLRYQQLYDKQDQNLNIYEVTSGFIDQKTWQDLNTFDELSQDIELSIKVDRWVLVEACKQLYNFLTQYPNARLLINLNTEILFKDEQLQALTSKLLTMINSQLQSPLILQFSAEKISKNLHLAQQRIAQLKRHDIEISLNEFGISPSSDSLLTQLDIDYICLHQNLISQLSSDKDVLDLQQKVDHFIELKPIHVLLGELNDMTMFANAWNVEARYLIGNYFQKKLDRLIDVQDQ